MQGSEYGEYSIVGYVVKVSPTHIYVCANINPQLNVLKLYPRENFKADLVESRVFVKAS